jgi:DNA-binding transcriptional LysR family regulator
MDLNLLRPFIAVAETTSFASAAKRLDVERSSVSRAIAALERAVNAQLFHRTTRAVALTTAGAALYTAVAPQLTALHHAFGNVPKRDEAPAGTLRITAPADIGAMLLAPVLGTYALRYPSVQLDVRLTNRRVNLIAEGFDVALRIGEKLADSTLLSQKLTTLAMQLYASPSYVARMGTPRSLQDLAKHHWLGFADVKLPASMRRYLAASVLTADDVTFLLHAAKQGIGITALPGFLVGDAVAAGQLVHLLPRFSVPIGGLHFLQPPTKLVPRKVTAFRDLLLEQLRGPLRTREP